jgi:hypothetical protein
MIRHKIPKTDHSNPDIVHLHLRRCPHGLLPTPPSPPLSLHRAEATGITLRRVILHIGYASESRTGRDGRSLFICRQPVRIRLR